MRKSCFQVRRLTSPFVGLAAAALLATTGCQVDVGGQTLPSPYWHTDDVQYFPPAAEFKLQREADAMEAAREEAARAGGDAREFGPPAGGPVVGPMDPGAAGPMGP